MDTYLETVVNRVDEVLGEARAAVIVTGSLALGDFDRARSDVDVFCVSHRALTSAEREAVAGRLAHESLPCPAVGLDFVLYQTDVLRNPKREIDYELAIETGAAWGTRVHPPGAEAGMCLGLEIARRHGRSLRGAPPAELVAPIPAAWIRAAVDETVRWHTEQLYDPFHDPLGQFAVLNACRAAHLVERGEFVSKRAGAEQWSDVEVVRQALDILSGARVEALPRGPVERFLDDITRRLADGD